MDPKSGVFQAITTGSTALRMGVVGVIAALLVTVGNAGGVGTTVAGIARIPFIVGIDRYLPAAFGKIHPRWKTPYISILVQAGLSARDSAAEPDSTRRRADAYQILVAAAIDPLFHSVYLHVRGGHQARMARPTGTRTSPRC